MARPVSTKPWFHTASGFWCVSRGGKRVYLDRDRAKAQRALNKLLADERQPDASVLAWLEQPFTLLADEFLEDVQARRSPQTYDDYHWSLERARLGMADGLLVGDVRKLHLAKIEQVLTKRGDSSTTIFKVLHAVQRVFTWATEHDLIEQSPLVGYKKPRPRQRNRIISPAEFAMMLRNARPPFRRLLLALRLTGCRPKELRSLLWEHVDLESGLIVIPDRRGDVTHKTASRQADPRPRVVPLHGAALRLLAWLSRRPHVASDHVFLNSEGNGWTESALSSRLRRLQAKAGITPKAGEQICLYSCRHTFATAAVGKVSDMELAELLGHTQARTTRRYVHLSPERLQSIARRAAGDA